MPKRKKVKDSFGNAFPEDLAPIYLNKWSINKTKDLASLLIKVEGSSLIQVTISKNEIFNEIYHLIRYKVKRDTDQTPILQIKDLDVLNDNTSNDFYYLMAQLPELVKKYQGEWTAELQESIRINPLTLEELPFLEVE